MSHLLNKDALHGFFVQFYIFRNPVKGGFNLVIISQIYFNSSNLCLMRDVFGNNLERDRIAKFLCSFNSLIFCLNRNFLYYRNFVFLEEFSYFRLREIAHSILYITRIINTTMASGAFLALGNIVLFALFIIVFQGTLTSNPIWFVYWLFKILKTHL